LRNMWSLTYPPHHGGDRRHGQNRVEQPPCASAAWRRTSVEAPPDRGRARVAGRRRTELSFRGKGLRGAYGRDDVASFFPATSPLAMSSPAPAAPAQLAHVESNDSTSTSRGPRLAAHALAVDRTRPISAPKPNSPPSTNRLEAVTGDIYGHVNPEVSREALTRLSDALS